MYWIGEEPNEDPEHKMPRASILMYGDFVLLFSGGGGGILSGRADSFSVCTTRTSPRPAAPTRASPALRRVLLCFPIDAQ
jgi:hypothetical protein